MSKGQDVVECLIRVSYVKKTQKSFFIVGKKKPTYKVQI